jgi:hypothetical protein
MVEKMALSMVEKMVASMVVVTVGLKAERKVE